MPSDKASIERDKKTQEEIVSSSKTAMLKSRVAAASARANADKQKKASTQTQTKAQTSRKKSASEKDQATQYFTQYATKMVAARVMQSNGATAANGAQMQQSAMNDQNQGFVKQALSESLDSQASQQDGNALSLVEKAALDYGKERAKKEIAKKAGGDFEKSTAMLNLLNTLEANANGSTSYMGLVHGADYLMDGGLLGKDDEDGNLDTTDRYFSNAFFGVLTGDRDYAMRNIMDGALSTKYEKREDMKYYSDIGTGVLTGNNSYISNGIADKVSGADDKKSDGDKKKSTNEAASA